MFNRFAPYPFEVIQNYQAWTGHVSIINWSTWIKSFFPDFLLLNTAWYRIPNLLLSLLVLVGIYKLSHRLTGNKIFATTASFFLLITPLFVHTAIFDFRGMLIIALTLYGLTFIHLHKRLLGILCFLLYLLAALNNDAGWQLYFNQLPNKASIKLDVDDRIRTEYRINNQRNILPIQLKRLVYNKYYWPFRLNLPEWFKIWDFDWWLAPSQIGSTVSRSLWGEKGLPRIYFWQAILVVIGIFFLVKQKNLKTPLLLALAAVWLVSGLASTEVLELSSLPLLIPISFLSTLIVVHLRSVRFGKILIVMLVFISGMGVLSTWNHILSHELYWRDNRPLIFSQIIQFINSCPPNSQIVATNLIGPTQYYYAWSHSTKPQIFWNSDPNIPKIDNVNFKHFDLSKSDEPASCLIGFPGEFLGNRSSKTSGQNDFSPSELPPKLHLVKSISFRDSVSYGNGNHIWLIQKD